ncbi:MAG: tripartite tricarboxylate transporter TctB family protein [Cloacibacillus sp.]
MKISDKIFGMVLVCFSLFVLVYARSLPSLPGYAYGSGFFPAVAAVFILGCGVMLILRGLKTKDKLVVLGEWTKSPTLVANICLIPANLVFYMLVSTLLGFVPTVIIMITFTIWWLRRKLKSSFIVAVASSLLIYVFFSKIMLVPLPAGFIGL